MPKNFYKSPLLVLRAAGALRVSAAISQTMPGQDQMMTVGECMANVDPSTMENMERKSEAFEADLKRVCKSDNREAALQRAKQFGLEMANDPAMKQIKACAAGLQMSMEHYEVPKEKLTEALICQP